MATPYELLLGMALLREKKLQMQHSTIGKLSDWTALLVAVGENQLLISQDGIDEIISLPSITYIPGGNTWLAGVINFHGELLPLIQLSHFLNMSTNNTLIQQQNDENRALVINTPYGVMGLIVDAVEGIKHYWSDDDLKIETLQGKLAKYCKTQLRQGEKIIPVLEMTYLVHSMKLEQAIVSL